MRRLLTFRVLSNEATLLTVLTRRRRRTLLTARRLCDLELTMSTADEQSTDRCRSLHESLCHRNYEAAGLQKRECGLSPFVIQIPSVYEESDQASFDSKSLADGERRL
jgi:hypothetical protein